MNENKVEIEINNTRAVGRKSNEENIVTKTSVLWEEGINPKSIADVGRVYIYVEATLSFGSSQSIVSSHGTS